MTGTLSKTQISHSRQRLIELMQEMNFGRIEELHIVDGDPVLLDPPPRVIREVKFGGDNSVRPERDRQHFLLKSQVVELFAMLDEIGDGIIELIEVKHGIPFRMLVAETLA